MMITCLNHCLCSVVFISSICGKLSIVLLLVRWLPKISKIFWKCRPKERAIAHLDSNRSLFSSLLSEILMKLIAELRKRKKKKSICKTNLELLETEAKLMRDNYLQPNGEHKNDEPVDSNRVVEKEENISESGNFNE